MKVHSWLGMEVKWPSRILKIFLPFACAYFLSYLLRNVNAVIAPGLVHEFGLDAGQLGSLTAAYFLSVAAMQIPIGVGLDRLSPSVVQASSFTLAAVGAILPLAAGGRWPLRGWCLHVCPDVLGFGAVSCIDLVPATARCPANAAPACPSERTAERLSSA